MCSARRYSGRAGDGDGMLSAEDRKRIKIEAKNDRKNDRKIISAEICKSSSLTRLMRRLKGVPTRTLSPSM